MVLERILGFGFSVGFLDFEFFYRILDFYLIISKFKE